MDLRRATATTVQQLVQDSVVIGNLARITLSIDDVAVDDTGQVTVDVSIDNTTVSGDGIGVDYVLNVTVEGQTQTDDRIVFPDETRTATFTFDTDLEPDETPVVTATLPFEDLPDVPELTVQYPTGGNVRSRLPLLVALAILGAWFVRQRGVV